MTKLTMKTGTEEDFFKRSRQLAKAADRGECIPDEFGLPPNGSVFRLRWLDQPRFARNGVSLDLPKFQTPTL